MHKLTLMLMVGVAAALSVSAATRTEAAAASAGVADGLRVASDAVSAIQGVQYRRYPAYGYPPGHPGYGYPADLNSTLGDGPGIGIQRANGGFSDSSFGFGWNGSISDGR